MPSMTDPDDRRHAASRTIRATPEVLYDAFVDPVSLARWLPPEGATGRFDLFEPHAGGRFRLVLTFASAQGKTSDNTDEVHGRFVELSRPDRIVQAVEFKSPDPAFAGTMTMTWTFTPVPGGAQAAVVAQDVPPGIGKDDHEAAMASTLTNLARMVEV